MKRRRPLRKSNLLSASSITIIILSLLVILESLFILYQQREYIKKTPVIDQEKISPTQGLIAIIIDDWGYNINHCEQLQGIDSPIAVSVLPDLPYSKDIAACAHQQNKDVLLHLPLEPHISYEKYPNDYIIKTDMSKEKIKKLLRRILSSVPHIEGINNHMGSKATEDENFMRIVLGELKKRGLFFVDSLVTQHSISQKVAKQMGILNGSRDVFLDNESDADYIAGQFAQLAQIAREKGYAIGIAHDRILSLRIIAQQIKEYEKKGFKFVPVEEILKIQ